MSGLVRGIRGSGEGDKREWRGGQEGVVRGTRGSSEGARGSGEGGKREW